LQSLPVLQTHMEKIGEVTPGLPPGASASLRSFATIIFYGTMILFLGIGVGQLVAYTLSSNYLASDYIAAVFQAHEQANAIQASFTGHRFSSPLPPVR